MIHYTLRKAGDPSKPLYELSKWDENRTRPLEVYVQWIVQRSDGSFRLHSCNCPSRSNPCKHAAISEALLNTDVIQLPVYYHDGEKVKMAADIPDAKDLKGLFDGI